ncbi:glycoside hydrolase superfamily [Peziza echinospora]|nr:glycoside hydrolase superfamily [Peziza echinospora]
MMLYSRNLLVAAILFACAVNGVLAGDNKNPKFKKVTAEEVWGKLNPGWNLGNTLDAVPDEGSWNNPKVAEYTFDDIKAAKFKSVRIPVTWTGHFDTEAPDYIVNKAWLDRVEQVVDYALKRDFWTVLNVHHDSWQWADYSKTLNDPVAAAAATTKFVKLWEQISTRFQNKSELLIFEPLNEPAGDSTQEVAEKYNVLNQLFVDVVRGSGGFNKDRLLTLPGLNTNIKNTVEWWKEPKGVGNYILHIHDYDPWSFVSGWWGKTMWGSESDQKEIEDTFKSLKSRFAGAPSLVGEWGVTEKVERGAGWNYFDFMVRKGREYKLAMQLWDNGADHFDRAARKWRDPTRLQIIQAAAAGINNTLPKYGQEPVVYFKTGEEVPSSVSGGRTININYNGNTITGLYVLSGTSKRWLNSGRDYSLVQEGVKFKDSYLKYELTQKPSQLGVLQTVYVVPSKGASWDITIQRYSKPTLKIPQPANVTVPHFTINSTTPYLFPINWGGTTLATVKAIYPDTGLPIKDEWTQYLGPLEAGRLNWSGDFEANTDGVLLTSSLLEVLKASGRVAELTLEFWPREVGNNITTLVEFKA